MLIVHVDSVEDPKAAEVVAANDPVPDHLDVMRNHLKMFKQCYNSSPTNCYKNHPVIPEE